MQLHNKRVLITGGSSGIGFALAQAFEARSSKVFITGRRKNLTNLPRWTQRSCVSGHADTRRHLCAICWAQWPFPVAACN